MTKFDTHIHTTFSPDGISTAEEHCAQAERLGISFVALTDHCDPLYCDPRFVGLQDFDAYAAAVERVRCDHPGLVIGRGIELGYHPKAAAISAQILERLQPDYVINSVHQVDGAECYYPQFFADKDIDQAYTRYFCTVLDSLDAPYHFDAVGHLGYVCRNAPWADRRLERDSTWPLIDQILKRIIQLGALLELNTSVCSAPYPFLPSPDILRRYVALGGRRVTFGSDAHRCDDLLRGWSTVVSTAAQCGVTHLVHLQNRQLIAIPTHPEE